MGLIAMTPSIPVSDPDCVWADKKPPHMIRTARAIKNVRNCIGKFTLTASRRSIITKPGKIELPRLPFQWLSMLALDDSFVAPKLFALRS